MLPFPWDKAFESRWLWDARREYLVNELGLTGGDEAVAPKRPVVAFYGPSQVGKSTVILRLIGLSEDNHKAAEYVLRGERPPGCSATITALRYEMGRSDLWEVPKLSLRNGVVVEETRELEDGEARVAFGELRRFLSDPNRGETLPHDPLRVGIPRRLFSATADRETSPIMVDLPGEGSSEKAEKHHVPRLIRKWLPIASSIVVVLRLNNVIEFAKLRFGSEDSEDNQWMYWPGDVSLVLTRAVSEGTIRERICEDFSLSKFRSDVHDDGRFAEEVCKSSGLGSEELSRAKETLARVPIFPVEFGDSLQTLRRNDPELLSNASVLLGESIDALREHIVSAATEESAFLATDGLRVAARNRQERMLRACTTSIERRNEQLRGLRESVSQLRSDRKNEADLLEGNKQELVRLREDFGNAKSRLRDLLEFEERELRLGGDWTLGELRQAAYKYQQRIEGSVTNFLATKLPANFEPREFDLENMPDEHRRDLCFKLKSRWIPYFGVFGRRSSDWSVVMDNARHACKGYRTWIESVMEKEADRCEADLKGRCSENFRNLESLDKSIEDMDKRISKCFSDLKYDEKKHKECDEEVKRIVANAGNAGHLMQLVAKAFEREVKRSKRELIDALPQGGGATGSPSEIHAALVSWTVAVLRKERLVRAWSGVRGGAS